MLRIDSHKESKFTCKRSILMEIPGLVTLLKLLISIQKLFHCRANSISGIILVPLPGQIVIPRSIPILQSILIPETTPESAPESNPESAPESAPDS